MSVTDLAVQVERLESELHLAKTRLARATADPVAATRELAASRAYAFDANAPADELAAGCLDALDTYGFCALENVIPAAAVDDVREEVVAANRRSAANLAALQRLPPEQDPSLVKDVELRPVRRRGHPPKPPCDIIWMPQLAEYMTHPALLAVARRKLDDHLRIAQLHVRIIQGDRDGASGGFGPPARRGNPAARGWHTDWPHDLTAYGVANPLLNAGCIRQPFPDLAMCVVMIFYLTDADADADADSGGTFVVPGSHRDPRNPREPDDGISPAVTIPGEMQVDVPAGSVFIQDSRCWHASATTNPGFARVAVVTRWCPWWLAVDDFAPGDRLSIQHVSRPLALDEYLALPAELQPFMRHRCPEVRDTLQQPVLDRAAAAAEHTRRAFELLHTNAHVACEANDDVRVPIPQSRTRQTSVP